MPRTVFPVSRFGDRTRRGPCSSDLHPLVDRLKPAFLFGSNRGTVSGAGPSLIAELGTALAERETGAP